MRLLPDRLSRLIACGAAMLAACGGEGTAPVRVNSPAAMAAVGDTLLDLTVAAVVQTPPSVRVVDDGGAPVGDVEVTFATEGGGSATGVVTKSNGSGIATVGSWAVGTKAGEYKLVATVSGLAPIVFRARARAGAVSRLIVMSGDEQSDSIRALLAEPIVVLAEDVHRNRVAGVEVAFFAEPASGTLSPATVTTDADGVASTRWSLGATVGPASARAAVGTTITTTFSATAEWPKLRSVALASGYSHNCAILPDGPTYCWGDNSAGQLGDGTTTDRSIAVRSSGSLTFKAVTAGAYHSCGLTSDGRAFCWGLNNWGQLGDGSKTSRSNPAAVATSVRFASLDAGANTTCGLSVDSEVYCWGFMAGSSTLLIPELPRRVSGAIAFSSIALSNDRLCAISTGGATHCFAGAWSSEVGDYMWQPQVVSPSPAFTALTGGLGFTCGLTQSGAAYCWGWNQYGQRGDGTSDPSSTTTGGTLAPTLPVAGNHVFRSIDAGYSWVCGTTIGDETYCWGQNSWGAFGVLGAQINPTPVLMPNAAALVFTASSHGVDHSCAIASTTVTYCWGGGFDGQLGDGLDQTFDPFHARATPGVARRR